MAEQPRRAAKPAREAAEDHAPWKPTAWDPADATALQALVRGDCPPNLQQRAVAFIINDLCGTYDQPFRPGGPEAERDTSFALGKMWVGQQIVKLIKTKVSPGGEQP